MATSTKQLPPPFKKQRTSVTSTSLVELLHESVTFTLRKFEEPYSLYGTFSSVKARLRNIPVEGSNSVMEVECEKIFDVSTEDADHFLKEKFPLIFPAQNEHITEMRSFFETILKIISPLASSVILNSSYKSLTLSHDEPRISARKLGIGTIETWYGIPDARIRAETSESVALEGPNQELESDEDSDGTTTCFEAKIEFSGVNEQVVATAVVSSFTEHNCHQSLNSAIPTFFIDKTAFCIIIYDCVEDLLLVSNRIKFLKVDDVNDTVEPVHVGLFMMWIAINHRNHLRKLKPEDKMKSGFLEFAKQYNRIDFYSSLREKNVSWQNTGGGGGDVQVMQVDLSTEGVPRRPKKN